MTQKMRLIHIVIGCYLILTCGGYSQGIIHPDWFLKYTSPLANGDAEAWGIDVDGQGNLYWATSQYRPVFGALFDVMIYKLDASGRELWSEPTIYEGLNNQQAYITRVVNNRVYVAGRDCRANGCDMFILALDAASGDTLWSTRWDLSGGYEEADGLMTVNDGIFLTGWVTGETTKQDIGLLKLDHDGNIRWSNTWGSGLGDHADGHAIIDDSIIYIAGLYGGSGIFNSFDGQALLAKFSRIDGSYVHHVTFGRDDSWMNFENALGLTSDGSYLYVVGATTVAANNWDIFVAKYDKNLNRIWYTIWGGGAEESARAIAINGDGNIYVAGNTKSFGAGDIDVFLLIISPEGDVQRYYTWGEAGEDHSLDIVIDENILYLTGLTKSFHPEGKKEAILLKINLDSLVSGVLEQFFPPHFFLDQNFPNPFCANTAIRFHTPITTHISVKMYDQFGREIRTFINEVKSAGTHTVHANLSGLSSGIYFLRLQAVDFVSTRMMILTR